MAYHQQRDFQGAAKWFNQLLNDSNSGGLQREALGRLIEVYTRTGQTALARQFAKKYLDQYPSGPHATLAKSTLK